MVSWGNSNSDYKKNNYKVTPDTPKNVGDDETFDNDEENNNE